MYSYPLTTNTMIRYDIYLDPFLSKREEYEEVRASRARSEKTRKIRKVQRRFVSVNNMYPISRGGGKRLSAEGRIYKEYISEVMRAVDEVRETSLKLCDYYTCCYVFFMTQDMLFYKNGELRRVDVSNMLKAAEDAVFEHMLEDDSLVVSISGHKRLTVEEPKLTVLIEKGDVAGPIDFCGCRFDTSSLEYGKVLPG